MGVDDINNSSDLTKELIIALQNFSYYSILNILKQAPKKGFQSKLSQIEFTERSMKEKMFMNLILINLECCFITC